MTRSTIGYTLSYDSRDNRIRPTRGHSLSFTQDFAGLGGSVKYLRNRLSADKYWPLGSGFIFSLKGEAGYIKSFEKSASASADPVRLVDRFFLGEPQLRGFDIRGVGPRIVRKPYLYDANGVVTGVNESRDTWSDDSLGGRAYYLAHAEIEIPLGSGARDLGLRPSIFADIGAVFGVRRPTYTNGGLIDLPGSIVLPTYDANGLRQCWDGTNADSLNSIPNGASCPTGQSVVGQAVGGFKEFFLGDTPKPRLSVGFGVNWNSPFGPFRIDIAKAIITAPGDDTKLITFNIGTQF